ncbi:MAG: FKBP-type peptidyl-prolyl cis-trans isomerase [Saprospiraceae bacterium]|nr:FKBP-type peptidyl-prolyl cis-trans isomerase [Saprospiraceae bacterium]
MHRHIRSLCSHHKTRRPKQAWRKATIILSYKGYYTDGVVFDQSPQEQKVTLKLPFALKGLQYGLGKFGKMSEGSIIIPSGIGYGSNPPFGVRKNAILIYDVKVDDFN